MDLGALTTEQLFAEHAERDFLIGKVMEEQLEIHREITRREHEQHAARLNPDRSLDQMTTPGKRG